MLIVGLAFAASGASATAAVAPPVFTPNGGTHNDQVVVSMTTSTPGATIYFTTDGSDPDPATDDEFDPDFPPEFDVTTTVKAIAVKAGESDSTITTATFTIVDTTPPIIVQTPVFTPPGGSYNDVVEVALTCATPGATILYTTNGTEPTEANSEIYDPESPLSFTETTVLKAFATADTDDTPSAVVSATYTVVDTSPPIVVATPVIAPISGTYNDIVNVTISCATEGAQVYYTTDGTDPTPTNGELYNSFDPPSFTQNVTVKAIAVRTNDFDSAIATATYTVMDNPTITVAAPTFQPKPGRYFDFVEVLLTSSTPGATIYYTIDGTDPVVDPNLVFDPEFPEFIAETTVIKAIAARAGDITSAISTGTYQVLPLPRPKLKLTGSKNRVVTSPKITLRGKATFAEEVTFQVGTKKTVRKAKGVSPWKIKLKLVPGVNVVTITGVGLYENSKPLKVTLTYRAP